MGERRGERDKTESLSTAPSKVRARLQHSTA
jgi:hypothetical protein